LHEFYVFKDDYSVHDIFNFYYSMYDLHFFHEVNHSLPGVDDVLEAPSSMCHYRPAPSDGSLFSFLFFSHIS